jgi:CTP synthase (UTP-ammonia lyase)
LFAASSLYRTSDHQEAGGAARVWYALAGNEDGVTRRAQIAIVGDFSPANVTHQLTNSALEHIGLGFTWILTDAPGDWEQRLAAYDGVWIAPASPYRSMDGALAAVRYARERGVPLVGT